MGSKRKGSKSLYIREKVYREIARASINGPVDLFTLRVKFVKQKIVESGNKFDQAVKELQAEGRVVVKGKDIFLNQAKLKVGTLVHASKSGYIIFDGDNHKYPMDRRDYENYKSQERVVVAFNYHGGSIGPIPFIVSTEKDSMLTHEERASRLTTRKIEEPENPSAISDLLKLDELDNDLIYGRVMKVNQDNLVFIPNDRKRFRENIVILNDKKTLSQFQDKICTMRLVSKEAGDTSLYGQIVEIKGEAGNPVQEYDSIAESHGAIMGWGDQSIQNEIKDLPTEVDLSQYTLLSEDGEKLQQGGSKSLIDLRDLPFTTVDPADCKDMDDAIYSTVDEKGNLIVYTAVANISKFFDMNSEIGKRYFRSVFTKYAPNKAYNITPSQLATNIGSFNEEEDRLAGVAKVVVNPKTGLPISGEILDAVIRSHAKYSYEQAQEICDNNPELTYDVLKKKIDAGEELSLDEQVVMNAHASEILWKGFNKRNLIEFDTNDEYDIKFSDDMSDIEDITQHQSTPYNKVIEAFMLTTNEATARCASEYGIPFIYRVHEEPAESRVEQAAEFFAYLNIDFDDDLSPESIKELISRVKGTSKEKIVNNFLVRMQSKAQYNGSLNPDELVSIKRTKKNACKGPMLVVPYGKKASLNDPYGEAEVKISHFGLQSPCYAHFTAAIRRSPDYVNQHNIFAFMHGEKLIDSAFVKDYCGWVNQMQDETDLAEREFQEVSSAIWCEKHINDVMKGHVAGFKKIKDSKFATVDDMFVIVENEEKGIRVMLPAEEVLASRGVNTKNIALSPYGSALINRETRAPLLTLCTPITFRITQANRITREVAGSMNLTPEAEIDYFENDSQIVDKHAGNSTTASTRRQKMIQNRQYKETEEENNRVITERKKKKGKKVKRETINRGGPEYNDDLEAFEADKDQGKRAKRQREEDRFSDLDDFSDYILGEIDIDDEYDDDEHDGE